MERYEAFGQEGAQKQGCSDRDPVPGSSDQTQEVFYRTGADGRHPEAADVGIARLEAVSHR
jgi:hypothetical protein